MRRRQLWIMSSFEKRRYPKRGSISELRPLGFGHSSRISRLRLNQWSTSHLTKSLDPISNRTLLDPEGWFCLYVELAMITSLQIFFSGNAVPPYSRIPLWALLERRNTQTAQVKWYRVSYIGAKSLFILGWLSKFSYLNQIGWWSVGSYENTIRNKIVNTLILDAFEHFINVSATAIIRRHTYIRHRIDNTTIGWFRLSL